MMPLLLRKYLRVFILIITIGLCSAPQFIRAQYNPYNMNTQFSAHQFYESSRDFFKHANDHWNQFNMALAASGGKDMLFRFELGAGIIMTDGHIVFALRNTLNEVTTSDTSMAFDAKPADRGLHIAWCSGRKLSTLSRNSAIILSYGMSYDGLKWKIPEFTMEGRKKEFDWSTNTIGVPVYLDYKSGAEAMLDITKHVCFTAGAGILPAYTLTVGSVNGGDVRFSVRPTARMEFGLTTKFICFKIQATGILGTMKFLNNTTVGHDIDYYAGLSENFDAKITGHSQFILSLVLMSSTTSWQYRPMFR